MHVTHLQLPSCRWVQRRRSRGTCARCRAVSVTADLSVENRAAAQAAVDAHVRSGHTIALGSGPLVSLAVEYVSRLLADGRLKNVVVVPANGLAAQEAAFQGVPCALSLPSTGPDVLIEQPDFVDNDHVLSFVCGRATTPAQPDLRRAQELRESSARVVLLVQDSAVGNGEGLDGAVPVLLPAAEWEEVAEELDDLFLGDATVWRRPMSGTADPQGGPVPYVSPEGHTIVDIRFEDGFRLNGEPATSEAIVAAIESVPGVLAHGLAVGRATAVYVPNAKTPTEPRLLFPMTLPRGPEQ